MRGAGCSPNTTLSSSDKEVGSSSVRNRAAANNPLAVEQNAKGEAIPDEPVGEENGQPINEKHEAIPREQSGLFCPYFQGTTTVTIEAGGLKSSLPVTVQAGSVREPCGTVPQHHLAAATASATAPVPPPAPAPAPVGPSPAGAPPVVPVPPPPPVVAAPVPPARPLPAPPPPFFLPPAPIAPLLAFVPPPVPTPARPTPPSGTSAVTSPVEMAEHEEEEEERHRVGLQPGARLPRARTRALARVRPGDRVAGGVRGRLDGSPASPSRSARAARGAGDALEHARAAANGPEASTVDTGFPGPFVACVAHDIRYTVVNECSAR